MADGNVIKLLEGVLSPVGALLDGLFYAGALYGAKSILNFAWRLTKGFRTYFIPFGRMSSKNLSEELGKWVLIAGGTSGIGLAFAHEFARRKMNVILISRSYDDLVFIVSDLQSQYSIQVLGIHADFCLGEQVFREIEEALHGYEIGILVNSVGIRYDHPQYFALLPHDRMWQLLCVNVMAPCVLSHTILPQMLERRRGAIINVCSNIAAAPATPLTAGYSACMAYVDTFSRTLHHENKHRGIIAQTLLPCFVTSAQMAPTLFTPTPHTYVENAIATLGVSAHTCGYWPHALQSWLISLVPRSLWIRLTMYFNTTARKRSLNKARLTRGGQLFTRRAQRHALPRSRLASGRPTSSLSLRRTPSPHRRVSTVEPPGMPSKREGPNESSVDLMHKPTGSEDTTIPFRTNTGSSFGSLPSPVPESHMTSTPIPTPDMPSTRGSGGHGVGGAFRFSMSDGGPMRSLSVASIEPGPRSPALRRQRHSRVLVVPSVATVTFVPQSPASTKPASEH